MIIPGILVSIATFPGVIVHELAHQLFCRFNRVAVLEVCYFQTKNPAGYVIHEAPSKKTQSFWIGVGPFLVNTILGAIISMSAAIPVLKFSSGSFLDYFLIWLGVSIAMHSFPSTGDAKNIWNSIKSDETSLLMKIVATPIVGLIYLGAVGSFFWLDFIYGLTVAMLIPNIIIYFY